MDEETDLDKRMQITTVRMGDGRRYLIYYTFDHWTGGPTETPDNVGQPSEDPERP